MSTRTVRRTTVTLPALDQPDLILAPVDVLKGGRSAGFVYADADLRELDLADAQLVEGRVTRLRSQRTVFEDLRVDSVAFEGCELSLLRWTGGRLSRVVFSDCRLMGSIFDGVVLDHVIFDRCRLDYASLLAVRTAGPVIFSGCSLRETGFTKVDLTAATFDACTMNLTAFDSGRYAGCDLRGNDLSTVRGVGSLRRVVIDRPQLLQLAQALAEDLDVAFGEDLQD
ncbi:pentapeptide repeat-containing protein [Streptomyces mobaraensis]|uniref:pentapeptide repeat-containing protein n=1 Tax=Streptomyces mobaraensis TaxID=35621 RepID=UPI003320E378